MRIIIISLGFYSLRRANYPSREFNTQDLISMTAGSLTHSSVYEPPLWGLLSSARPFMLQPRISHIPLVVVLLAHAVLILWALNTVPTAPSPVTPPKPLTVNLIKPALIQPAIEAPQAKPEIKPAPPKPVVQTPPQPPVLVAKRQVPSPMPVIETHEPIAEPEPAPKPSPAPPRLVADAPNPAPSSPTPPRPADYLNNPKPPYPVLSRRLGEEGVVRLNVLVHSDGSVARLELAKSSGFARLDQSAMDTVQSSWKFEPARQDGSPVAAWVIVPIQFTVRS